MWAEACARSQLRALLPGSAHEHCLGTAPHVEPTVTSPHRPTTRSGPTRPQTAAVSLGSGVG